MAGSTAPVDALRRVHDFHARIGALLEASDAWCVQRCGWTPRSELALARLSFRLDRPSRWMPGAADRWYHTGGDGRLAYVAVLWGRAEGVLDAPLVLTGVVRSREGVAPPRWLATEGAPEVLERWVDLPPRVDLGVRRHQARAVPLAALDRPPALVQRVITPLVAEIGRTTGAAARPSARPPGPSGRRR